MSFFTRFLKPAVANTHKTSTKTILDQMHEPRPLPMGQKQFDEWADRIISGALVPTENKESLKGVLCVFIQELGPTESHKPDAYFIHKLRKAAANEVAQANFHKIKQARIDAAKAEQSTSDNVQAIKSERS